MFGYREASNVLHENTQRTLVSPRSESDEEFLPARGIHGAFLNG
ncbi:MAG: hypothetical protein R3Y04_05145 [Rikenellaceae bacterium]